MDKKNIPILLMLVAGAITCIITFIEKYSVLTQLLVLFIVLVIFYCIGTVIKWAFISFERRNEEQNKLNAQKKNEDIKEEEEEEE